MAQDHPRADDSPACIRKTIHVDGLNLSYWELGDACDNKLDRLFVCLHATGHSAEDFVDTAVRWQRQGPPARWIALDWPGQGLSEADREPASGARYARLLQQFLTALQLNNAVLIGNSIGGAAAIEAAASQVSAPESEQHIRALVLADPGGLGAVDAFTRKFCAGVARFFEAGARGARWFSTAYALYYRMVLRESVAATARHRVVADGPRCAPVLAEAWRSFAEDAADLRSRAAAIRLPVLFTWAKSDQILAYARSQAGVESFPDHAVCFTKGGHCAFLEDPAAFDAALRGFLDRL